MGIEFCLRLEFRPRVTEVTDVDFGFCNPRGWSRPPQTVALEIDSVSLLIVIISELLRIF